MSQHLPFPSNDWEASWRLSEAEALPFRLPPRTPLPSAGQASLSFADSSVSRPYSDTYFLHTVDQLRSAGFQDRWTIKDAPDEGAADAAADAAADSALAAWGNFLLSQTLTSPFTMATSSRHSTTPPSTGPTSYASLPVGRSVEESPVAQSPPPKRTRVVMACATCRKAQKKCEGGAKGETCLPCIKRGLVCVYEPITKASSS